MKSIKNFSDLGVLTSKTKAAGNVSEVEPRSGSDVAAPPKDGRPSIRLKRPIKIYCWRVIGQVARASKRIDLMPVLLRARESGSTDAGDIAGHLFFEARSRRIVAQRLLDLAERYRLLEQRERRYFLSESGRIALETEQVFVPEYGTWTIWASDDPLLRTPILHVEPWVEPPAYDEILGKGRDSVRDRQFKKLPGWVRDTVGIVLEPLVSGAPLRIDQLEADGEVATSDATLRAAWDVSQARLRVEGSLARAQVNTVIDAPTIGAHAVWKQLLQAEGLWPQWDLTSHVLRVGFEDVTPQEQESLIRVMAFSRPDITGLGAFDATTVDGVSLQARTELDACRWAESRLNARVRDYATEERFSAWTTEATSPFAEFRPTTPSRKQLADAAKRAWPDRPKPSAWHLVAAEDWSL